MRLKSFLNELNEVRKKIPKSEKSGDISSALALDEPQVGKKYGTSAIKRKLEMINAAISELGKKEQTDATEAQMADLEDKRDKWQNVDKETEPADTQDTRPAGSEASPEAPPEEGDTEMEPEEADNKKPVEKKKKKNPEKIK